MNNNHSTKISQRKVLAVRFAAGAIMFIFGMLLGFCTKAQTTTKENPTNFYAVTGKGLKDTSWIFGTYHLVKSSYLDEVPAVVRAFNKSKGVAVELVLDSASSASAQTKGMLKDKTLSDLLDKPFRDSLEAEVKTTLGVGLARINNLKPINVALTLSMIYILSDLESPIKKYSGTMLDGYFAAAGKQAGKKITEFETLDEQMNVLFNSSTDEEQVAMLKMFIRDKDEMKAQGKALIENWFKHDLNAMQELSDKGMQHFGSAEALLKNRNDKWMKTLPGLLKKQSQFIAVGALHLAGPDGLISQLRKLGYTLTPIKL